MISLLLFSLFVRVFSDFGSWISTQESLHKNYEKIEFIKKHSHKFPHWYGLLDDQFSYFRNDMEWVPRNMFSFLPINHHHGFCVLLTQMKPFDNILIIGNEIDALLTMQLASTLGGRHCGSDCSVNSTCTYCICHGEEEQLLTFIRNDELSFISDYSQLDCGKPSSKSVCWPWVHEFRSGRYGIISFSFDSFLSKTEANQHSTLLSLSSSFPPLQQVSQQVLQQESETPSLSISISPPSPLLLFRSPLSLSSLPTHLPLPPDPTHISSSTEIPSSPLISLFHLLSIPPPSLPSSSALSPSSSILSPLSRINSLFHSLNFSILQSPSSSTLLNLSSTSPHLFPSLPSLASFLFSVPAALPQLLSDSLYLALLRALVPSFLLTDGLDPLYGDVWLEEEREAVERDAREKWEYSVPSSSSSPFPPTLLSRLGPFVSSPRGHHGLPSSPSSLLSSRSLPLHRLASLEMTMLAYFEARPTLNKYFLPSSSSSSFPPSTSSSSQPPPDQRNKRERERKVAVLTVTDTSYSPAFQNWLESTSRPLTLPLPSPHPLPQTTDESEGGLSQSQSRETRVSKHPFLIAINSDTCQYMKTQYYRYHTHNNHTSYPYPSPSSPSSPSPSSPSFTQNLSSLPLLPPPHFCLPSTPSFLRAFTQKGDGLFSLLPSLSNPLPLPLPLSLPNTNHPHHPSSLGVKKGADIRFLVGLSKTLFPLLFLMGSRVLESDSSHQTPSPSPSHLILSPSLSHKKHITHPRIISDKNKNKEKGQHQETEIKETPVEEEGVVEEGVEVEVDMDVEGGWDVVFSEMDVFWKDDPLSDLLLAQPSSSLPPSSSSSSYSIQVTQHLDTWPRLIELTSEEVNIGFFFAPGSPISPPYSTPSSSSSLQPHHLSRLFFLKLLQYSLLHCFSLGGVVTWDQKAFDHLLRFRGSSAPDHSDSRYWEYFSDLTDYMEYRVSPSPSPSLSSYLSPSLSLNGSESDLTLSSHSLSPAFPPFISSTEYVTQSPPSSPPSSPLSDLSSLSFRRLPGALYTHNQDHSLYFSPSLRTAHLSWGLNEPERRIFCAHSLGLIGSDPSPSPSPLEAVILKYAGFHCFTCCGPLPNVT